MKGKLSGHSNWIAKDLKYIWHPYTQMKDCITFPPIFLERAKGVKLYDYKGNYYYDTISSWWCNVHGHCHPYIKKAITEQLKKLDHVLLAGFTHKSAILLAEKLVSITPQNLTKVFFSDNGSCAVECSLKMSFQYWGNIGKPEKRMFVCLDHAYHGDTIATMSIGGVSLFNKKFNGLFYKTFKLPSPYCYRCPMKKKRENCSIDCIRPLECLLEKNHREIAAIILEPLLLAAGGMIVYPVEYLARVSELAKRYDIHLILDEVATGFGRTGKMFACEYAKIEPDFMCLSKGITSGTLPLGVTLTTDKIYNAFYDDYEKKKTFYHGHTYTGNPIATSCAVASIEIFEKENTLERVKKIIPVFHQKLERFRYLSIVGDVRYIGMVGAIELVKDRKRKTPFSFKERIGFQIYRRALKKNLILRPLGNIIYFFLPLCINEKELDSIIKRSYCCISSFT